MTLLLAFTGGYCYNLSEPTQVSSPESALFFQMAMVISRLHSTPDYPAAGLWSALLSSHLRRMNAYPLAAIVLVSGRAAGFQSAIYHGRGASGALYIQGIVFFRAGHVPVGVGDLVGQL